LVFLPVLVLILAKAGRPFEKPKSFLKRLNFNCFRRPHNNVVFSFGHIDLEQMFAFLGLKLEDALSPKLALLQHHWLLLIPPSLDTLRPQQLSTL